MQFEINLWFSNGLVFRLVGLGVKVGQVGLTRLTLFGITDAVIIPVEGSFPAAIHWTWEDDILATKLVGVP